MKHYVLQKGYFNIGPETRVKGKNFVSESRNS